MIIDVLQLADLHFQRKWFGWLEEQVPLFDLVVISGDLICERARSATSLPVQAAWVVEWSKRLNPKGWVVISSGNHDHNNETIGFMPHDFSSLTAAERGGAAQVLVAEHWMVFMERDRVMVDGRQKILQFGSEKLVVTTAPDHFYAKHEEISDVEAMWKEGRKLAQRNQAMWLISQHIPSFDSAQVLGWSLQYEPQVVSGGHVHEVPGDWETNFTHRVGKGYHFHPGQIFSTPEKPSCVHIRLDLKGKQVVEAKRYPS